VGGRIENSKVGAWNNCVRRGGRQGVQMESLIAGLVGLVVLIAVFIIFRAVVLWYWKLDKIEEHLNAIRKSLAKEEGKLGNSSGENSDNWK
jgi:hypothetical protein